MRFIYVMLCLFFSTKLSAQTINRLKIKEESTFRINGTSNINAFECEITQGFSENEITVYYTQNGSNILFKNTTFSLPVNRIDCGNSHITRDLKDALHEKLYPTINFKLLSIEDFNSDDLEPIAEALITIAGKTNKYYLNYGTKYISENAFYISLTSKFKLQDFNITPPTALMGLIKVHDTITIDLNFKIAVLN
jgi:hypothetical protein